MTRNSRNNVPRDRLTRESSVFLLVDYQVGPLWESDAVALRREVVALASVATSLGVPIILTALSCDDWGPIIPELARVTLSAALIQRSVLDPWSVLRVREAIEATGRTQLVIAGVATEMCVCCAAVGARRDGYGVHAVLDVSGHFSPQAAAAAVLRMRARGVIVANCSTVLIELANGDLERGASELVARSLRHKLPPPPAAVGVPRRRRTVRPSKALPRGE